MIPGLPSVGGGEILILLVIILLFFGAKRIPDLARSLGRGTREFREGIREVATPDDKDEVVRDRKKTQEEPPSLDGETARSETPDVEKETEASHTGQKS
jgi:sec-independent protein translocase protein TatA